MPDRPKISKNLDINDFKNLIKYTTKLETGIKEYNSFAEKENIKVNEHFENR